MQFGQVKDSRGRVLEEGDEILLHGNVIPAYRVGRITKVVDPRAPQGLYRLELVSVLVFLAGDGQPNHEFTRIQTLAEAGPLPFTAPPLVTPPGDQS